MDMEHKLKEVNMEIIVKEPAVEERALLEIQPTWSCDVSEFPWSYDMKETCLLIKGRVKVTYGGGNVSFGSGDMVIFPKGLQCVWHVTEPVEKHYIFG